MLKLIARGSELCYGCTLYGPDDCHCLCHTQEIIYGKHEILWEMPASKIAHPEDSFFEMIIRFFTRRK